MAWEGSQQTCALPTVPQFAARSNGILPGISCKSLIHPVENTWQSGDACEKICRFQPVIPEPAMSEPEISPASIPAASTPSADSGPHSPHTLTIRVWPNIPILYPMAIAALICGIFSLMFGLDSELKRMSRPPAAVATADQQGLVTSVTATETKVVYSEISRRLKYEQVIALAFLAAFAYTMVVICTDIILTWALLGVFGAVIFGMGLFIANIYYNFLSGFFEFLGNFVPVANAHFYFAIFAIWVILMLSAVIYSRFHYVKIESNEVIVVGGVLDKRRRYSTLRMTYTKEVFDVFEYYLPFVRSGRLILRFANEPEPIVIDHVMQLDQVVKRLDHVTATLQVSAEDVAN